MKARYENCAKYVKKITESFSSKGKNERFKIVFKEAFQRQLAGAKFSLLAHYFQKNILPRLDFSKGSTIIGCLGFRSDPVRLSTSREVFGIARASADTIFSASRRARFCTAFRIFGIIVTLK